MVKLLVFLSLAVAAFASDVLDLNDANFADEVGKADVMLVEFFAPWCGHCKRLAPEYEKAATSLLSNDPPVPLAKVDCTEQKDTCGKYGVSGYPTLKIFKGGELASDYSGPREADGIVKYMKKQAGPVSKDLIDDDALTAFIGNNKAENIAVVGFFSDAETDAAKAFSKAAAALESYRFAHTYTAEVGTKYEREAVVLFRPPQFTNKFEDREITFSGDYSQLKDWIKENAVGLCGLRTSDNAEDFKTPLVVALYEVDYVKNPKGSQYWRNRVMKVAKKFKDAGKNVNFAVSDFNAFRSEAEEHGLASEFKEKPIVMARGAKNEKFAMSDEFSMDTLEQFVNDFLDGKLEQYLKSEPVPDNSGEAVKVAVAKNFETLVNDPEKDVLIEFYAPWCGHCKSLEPKYKELAEKLADEPEITIAKMDATANDVPGGYEVRGFPTIFFAPKGSKDSPKKYEGGREVKDFLAYLARESTNPLAGYDRSGKKIKQKSEL